ncbi:MAG: MBL fold metallo-hydrolase [Candidatus Dormibacteria bacterium]
MNQSLTIHAVGGPTLLIELGGLRLLTDPTFDPPGSYPVGQRTLTKTTSPAIDLGALGRVDAVLLSHDQHPDNLDSAGRELLAKVPTVLSTLGAAVRLPGVRGLDIWEQVRLPRPDGSILEVTGTPAQHGPDGTGHLTGPVTGFVLSAVDLPTIYISGDNASLDLVDQVAERFPTIDVAVVFAGAARTPLLGDAYLTLTSGQAVEASRRLGARWVVPAHFNSWAHYTEGADQIRAACTTAGLLDRLVLLLPGERAELPPRDSPGGDKDGTTA